jgi:hypothetical protein
LTSAFTLYEFNETLERITTPSISPLILSWWNPLVVLCLVDRTTIEAEWQVPLVRIRFFYPLLVLGWFEMRI